LFGGGITNRPFLKDLLPLNLSELSFAEPKKETKLDPKELRKELGLPEDATDDQVMERVRESRAAATNKVGTPPDRTATTHAPNNPATDTTEVPGGPKDERKPESEQPPPGVPHPQSHPVQHRASLDVPLDTALSEIADPAVRRLMEAVVSPMQKRLAELERTNHETGVNLKLSEFSTGQKVLAPAVIDEFRAILAVTPVQLHEKVYGIMRTMRDGKDTVKLGETVLGGSSSQTLFEGKSATDVVMERTKKLCEADKDLSEGDAFVQVLGEDPVLYKAYQEDSYLFKA
jgi:hypothetical protein